MVIVRASCAGELILQVKPVWRHKLHSMFPTMEAGSIGCNMWLFYKWPLLSSQLPRSALKDVWPSSVFSFQEEGCFQCWNQYSAHGYTMRRTFDKFICEFLHTMLQHTCVANICYIMWLLLPMPK